MKAMGFSETFSTALETSLLAEAATGQVELIGAELAVLPFIMFGRAMRNHH
jgi:hypothetical protein